MTHTLSLPCPIGFRPGGRKHKLNQGNTLQGAAPFLIDPIAASLRALVAENASIFRITERRHLPYLELPSPGRRLTNGAADLHPPPEWDPDLPGALG